MRTSIHCALLETYNLYNTVAFTMISGFSMSFLLWTILSSSWAEFGLFPSPACARKSTSACHSVHQNAIKDSSIKTEQTMLLLPHYFFYPPHLPSLPYYPLASKVQDPGQHCDFVSPLFCTTLQERNTALPLIRK